MSHAPVKQPRAKLQSTDAAYSIGLSMILLEALPRPYEISGYGSRDALAALDLASARTDEVLLRHVNASAAKRIPYGRGNARTGYVVAQ